MCVYKGHYAPANLRPTLINGTVSVLFKKLCQSVLCLIPEYFLFVCFYTVSKVHFSRFAISAGDTAGVGGGGGGGGLVVCLSLLKRPKTASFCI